MFNSLSITDIQGKITAVNATTLKLLEYNEDEVIGQSLNIFFEDKSFFNQNFISRIVSNGHFGDVETNYISKSGAKIPILFTASVLYSYNAKKIIHIAHDNTERKIMEDSLRESEQSYKTLIQQSLDPIYTFDISNNQILETNIAFLNCLGYTQKELPNLTLNDFVAHDKNSIDNFFHPLVNDGHSQLKERKWKKKNGEFIDMLISANKIKQKGKDIIFVIAHNITEEKKAQKIVEHERKIRHIAINDAQEEERHRIATELHDGLGQMLTAISYSIDYDISELIGKDKKSRQSIIKIQTLIDDAIRESKRVAYDLIPILLKDFGLVPAINSLVKQINEQNKIAVKFNVYNFTERIDKKLETALYRITQEALNNIVKHSGATNTNIQVVRHPNSIVLVIDDDGKGFDVEKVMNSNEQQWRGIGLISIRERVQAFEGTLTIDSFPNKGTEILIEIPYSDYTE